MVDVTHHAPVHRLRVAAARAASVPGEVGDNARTAAALVRLAHRHGVRLLVFGELFLPGYHPPTWASPACDVDVDDERLEPLRQAARDTGVTVLVGASVRSPGGRFIATLLVDPQGAVRDVYHKQNLCGPDENRWFTPGTHGSTLSFDGWRLGLGICYDATFPEHARAAALDGCHAYVTGGAYVVGGEHRRDTYHSARALDNTFYVVFADAVGGAAPWTFGGGSRVYDPEGRAVSEPVGDDLVVAELDPEELRRTRQEHTMLADLAGGPSPRYFTEL
ncbi:carbon-nitrogen hydrolase family protein [Stackebrandtia nassauensis]|uniref:carbon-nitrogen hydrolase family protein n=1 Tax=Stackebrandtia nassauensis TaxID=283811 RepID=UPI0005A28689